MSAEYYNFGLLHSTREELRGNLAAEIMVNKCNETFGCEGNNEVKYICDIKSASLKVNEDIKTKGN